MPVRAAALVASLALASCTSIVTAARDHMVSVPLYREASAPTRVDVETRNGSIVVEESTKATQLEVHAEFRAGGHSIEMAHDRLEQFGVEVMIDRNGVHRIRPSFPDRWRHGDRAALRIRVPRLGAVDAHSANGRIAIHGADGDSTVTTNNGRIEVASTSGSLRVETDNGSVLVEDHDGYLSASSDNGRLEISLADRSRSPFHIETDNGSVSVSLGALWQGRVACRTDNGSVRHSGRGAEMRSARNAMDLDLGPSDMGSRIESDNGSITVDVR